MFDIKKAENFFRTPNNGGREDISSEKKEVQSKGGKKSRVFISLIPAEEKEYFIENLSMLLASGMDILQAIDSIKKEIRSSGMKEVIDNLREEVEAGSPIWKALENTKLFPAFILALIRIGERSGSLVKNLKVISIQQKKDRSFNAKIRSAMLYPIFVLSLTVVVGISIAWFILPRLTVVFDQLKVDLPLITKILIAFGKFIDQHGLVAVPSFVLFLGALIYFLFIFSRTKFIGQTILFAFPGIKRLIQETELARMGYILGTLLRAGLPVVDALQSLAEASTFYKYKKLYLFLIESIEAGNTFQQSFEAYKNSRKLVPITIQQMIMVGERSGRLPDTFLSIGETFEEKIDNTTKNLAVILEPVLLVIVWLGVVAVALAVILPIYSLIGGLNKSAEVPSSAPVVETVTPDQVSEAPAETETKNIVPELKIEILKTGTGFLNVRDANNTKGKVVGKVLPGQQYVAQADQDGWYQITLSDGSAGWVFGKYAKLINPQP